ncbi:MAG TPA: ion channel [Rhizomicrobium sp.]
MTKHKKPEPLPNGYRRFITPGQKRRMAVVKGQDSSRWTDFYHNVLTAPWWVFFVGLALMFITINAIFALAYMSQPDGLANARPGNFWDAFLFSVETICAVNYTTIVPKSIYANVVVVIEAFFGILNLALVTGAMFARFSRPFARVLFSNVAVIVPFEGVPTLMFRAANQRGNQIMEAEVTVSMARQVTTREGHAMRRFDEMKLVRGRSPLFALSWTVMHRIDEASPLHGVTLDKLYEDQVEFVIVLSGTDDTLSEKIYARHSYTPDEIRWGQRFVDILSVAPNGKRVVDLRRFHDTDPLEPIDAKG